MQPPPHLTTDRTQNVEIIETTSVSSATQLTISTINNNPEEVHTNHAHRIAPERSSRRSNQSQDSTNSTSGLIPNIQIESVSRSAIIEMENTPSTPAPTYLQRILNALQTHVSGAGEIEFNVGSRVALGSSVLPAVPSIPSVYDIPIPPIFTALPPLTDSSAIPTTLPPTLSSTLTSVATSLMTSAATSALTSTPTAPTMPTAATTATASTFTSGVTPFITSPLTSALTSTHSASSASTITPSSSEASTLTSLMTDSVAPSTPEPSSSSLATWATNGLNFNIARTSPPRRCILGLNEMSLRSELGISFASGHISGSEAVRTGIMQKEETGRNSGSSAFSEFSLYGEAGGAVLPLTHPFRPSEGAFPDLPFGMGAGAGARAKVRTIWNLNNETPAGKLKSTLINGALLGSHLLGAGIGAAIGTPLGARDHGMAVGANLLVGATTSALSMVGPFKPDAREYTLESEVTPAQTTLRFSLPTPTPTPIEVESYASVSVRPRARLNFTRIERLNESRATEDQEQGNTNNTASLSAQDALQGHHNIAFENVLEWDYGFLNPYRGNTDTSPERGNTDTSPERGNTDTSPERGNTEASLETINETQV